MKAIKIYGSGSDGNSVQVGSILIDAGLSTKKMAELGYDESTVGLLIITHHHADHCNEVFIRNWIQSGKPCVITDGVVGVLKKKGKLEDIKYYPNVYYHPFVGTFGEYHVQTIPQKHHNIINYACIIRHGEESMLYATDLDTVEKTDVGDGLLHLPQFDVLMLEGNYDEHWLNEYITNAVEIVDPDVDAISMTPDEMDKWVRQNYRNMPSHMSSSLFRAVQNRRHLSKQQARAYAVAHLKPGGVYYEMHRSGQFYEKPTD